MPNSSPRFSLSTKVSRRDKAFIARQLSVMVGSGLPVSQSVRSLMEQTRNHTVYRALEKILGDLENGYSFSEALKKHPNIFNDVFIGVIAAGEITGGLDKVLDLLADELERDSDFRSQAIGALLYPAFIIGAMIVVGIIMVTRIVPALESVFRESNVPLPWTTRTVVWIVNGLLHYWPWIAIFGALIGFAFYYYAISEVGKRKIAGFVLGIPVFGALTSQLEMSRMARVFGMMSEAGVPILQVLNSTAQAMDLVVYREALARVGNNVARGAALSQSMGQEKVLPVILVQMVSVGEQTGKLQQVFTKLAEYYESQTNQSIKNVTALTEPIVFVVVGLAVAFLVFSIIVPIYNIASVIG